MSQSDPATAIICISNPQLCGTMAGLKNMKYRVPDDVSVISFDGFNPTAGWYPSITSLEQDTGAVSDAAVDRLLQWVGGETSPPEIVRIRPRLCIEESCRAVGRAG